MTDKKNDPQMGRSFMFGNLINIAARNQKIQFSTEFHELKNIFFDK